MLSSGSGSVGSNQFSQEERFLAEFIVSYTEGLE